MIEFLGSHGKIWAEVIPLRFNPEAHLWVNPYFFAFESRDQSEIFLMDGRSEKYDRFPRGKEQNLFGPRSQGHF